MAETTTEGAAESAAEASKMAEVTAKATAEVRVVGVVGGEGHPVGRRGDM